MQEKVRQKFVKLYVCLQTYKHEHSPKSDFFVNMAEKVSEKCAIVMHLKMRILHHQIVDQYSWQLLGEIAPIKFDFLSKIAD